MDNCYLLAIDTTGIQPYIFGSNRLRENIGASHLVWEATMQWVLDHRALPQPNNVADMSRGAPAPDPKITDSGTKAEVIYVGGGNALIAIRGEETARDFVAELSRRALERACGLNLVVARREWDPTTPLGPAWRSVSDDLERNKRAPELSAALLGLGVTAACASTGLPAVDITPPIEDEEGYPASAEVMCKVEALTAANDRLRETFKRQRTDLYYPLRFEHLGHSEGEMSYAAVVHADGNGIGERFRQVREDFGGGDPRLCIEKLRQLSTEINEASVQALRLTLADLDRSIEGVTIADPQGLKTVAPVQLAERTVRGREAGHYLPFRPLVYGGDDVTFVADGRLGLSLAISYLRHFEATTERMMYGKATACAGVAIVKLHYPFARAYALSEDLCKQAKVYRRRIGGDSLLDWHFATSGLAGGIGEIRRREYTVPDDRLTLRPLTLRPLTLDANPKEALRTWNAVLPGIRSFQGKDKNWRNRRNKVKALRDALRSGEHAVQEFRTLYDDDRPLPAIAPGYETLPLTGWEGERCGYFDAIEAADWYMPLRLDGREDI